MATVILWNILDKQDTAKAAAAPAEKCQLLDGLAPALPEQ